MPNQDARWRSGLSCTKRGRRLATLTPPNTRCQKPRPTIEIPVRGRRTGAIGRKARRGAALAELRLAALEWRFVEDTAVFLAAYAKVIAESSIFAHEGRHAIDRRLGIDADLEEREYRAKLSEVVFAPLPRLALCGILNPNIGSSTPHGRANRRIIEGGGVLVSFKTALARCLILDLMDLPCAIVPAARNRYDGGIHTARVP